ncbi:PP2A regulatory subunit TAP46-like protein, partial [Trifolium medium]|nr:PP2A regulatory subunit TAP46-like protein [Trifolium medium]
VPYYLAELTEKIAQDDRIQILKASQAKLKIARFKRQKAAESKLLEIKERKERRGRSTRAAALSTPVEAGEEELLDDDGEEERE